jgi:chaperonin cofactor prefoldin
LSRFANQNEKQSNQQIITMIGSSSSNNPGYMMASQVDAEVAKYRTLQESIQQQRSDLQLLTNQSIENELVLSELQLVKADESSSTKVYKMVGPTLLKQDLEEAKETVQKRIEFIQVCVCVCLLYRQCAFFGFFSCAPSARGPLTMKNRTFLGTRTPPPPPNNKQTGGAE